MTHSAAMAAEILPGKTMLEALNTDLVCDAINTAMRELFLQIVYGRTQTAFSEDGLPIGAGLEDLGKGLRSPGGHHVWHQRQGRPLSGDGRGLCAQAGAWTKDDEVIGYQFVHLGKMMEAIKNGMDPKEAYEKNIGTYGRFDRGRRSTSIPVKNKCKEVTWQMAYCLKVTKEESARSRTSWHNSTASPI